MGTDFGDPSLAPLVDVGQRSIVIQGRRSPERPQTPLNPPQDVSEPVEALDDPEPLREDDATVEKLREAGYELIHGAWRR